MKIMFLMGGADISQDKEDYPLYLTEINEKLILEQQISYCQKLNTSEFIFCIKEEDLKKFRIKEVIEQLVTNSKIISIAGQTKGAVCTALLGMAEINNNEELLIMAIDDFVENEGVDIVNTFRQNHCDAGVVSFTSVHPRYSFAKVDDKGDIIEFAEKKPISKNALVSFYYFKKGSDFVNCAMEVIRKDNPVNDAFFISQVLNEMILKQKKILIYKIDNNKFHPLKTKAQLAQYLVEFKEIKDSK